MCLLVTAPVGGSACSEENDGYVKALHHDDLWLGSDDSRARARINADLSDNFNVDVVFDYTEASETLGHLTQAGIGGFNGNNIQLGLPVQPFAHFYNAIWSGNGASCTTAAGQASDTSCYGPVWNTGDPYAINSVYTDNGGNQIVPEQDVEVMGGAITLTWNIGNVELKSTRPVSVSSISASSMNWISHPTFSLPTTMTNTCRTNSRRSSSWPARR